MGDLMGNVQLERREAQNAREHGVGQSGVSRVQRVEEEAVAE